MIEKISDNLFRFKVGKTRYTICLTETRYRNDDSITFYRVVSGRSRWNVSCFFRKLNVHASDIYKMSDNEFKDSIILCRYWNAPIFKTRIDAIRFLYFLDRYYNVTPGSYNNFINLPVIFHD